MESLPSTLRLRPAEYGDASAILAINRSAMPGVTMLDDADLEELFRFSSYFRVAEHPGEIVAYLAAFPSEASYTGEEFVWFRARYPSFLYIDQVAVAEEQRRRGIASRLYRDLERFAREGHSPRLTCEVNLRPPNLDSLHFHAAQGYAEVGTLPVKDGRVVSLLVKELGP